MSRIAKSIFYRSRAFKNNLARTIGGISKRFSNQVLDKYVRLVNNAENLFGPLTGKSVLEIGCDPNGDFLKYLCATRSVGSAIGINPCLTENTETSKYSLLKLDARKLPFADNSIDAILSISVFEHVQDLDVALSELYRVLRPGGYLFTEFGPIWSSVWGHHLWFYHGNNVRDWNNTPLPPYAHLLMSEDELRSWCTQKYKDNSLTAKVCDFVFRSPDQNRLFFSDYHNLFLESDFDILFMTGYPDLPLAKAYSPSDSIALFEALKQKFPDKSGFGYHVITAALTKPNTAK